MTETWKHFKFLIFVTGKGEVKYLSKIFQDLAASGVCDFQVVENIRQRDEITSEKKRSRLVGTKAGIHSKDWREITAPARRWLSEYPDSRILLIDDLEQLDEQGAIGKFKRYRQALDEVGASKERTSVHFLVKMLEAYFFADVNAVNQALALSSPISPCTQDVEEINHPKGQIKKVFPSYKETEHPGLILEQLSLDVVLANPEWCASLRTCVKWIVGQLASHPFPDIVKGCQFDRRFHLCTGKLYTVTKEQL